MDLPDQFSVECYKLVPANFNFYLFGDSFQEAV